MMGKLQQKQSSRIWLESRFSCAQENFLRVTYVQNCTHIAEEIESSEKPNVSWGSSGEVTTGKL